MTEFEAVKQYTYPDEAQSLRVKQMTDIADDGGLPYPGRVASNADRLYTTPEAFSEAHTFEPARNNEGLRYAVWALNTYKLRLLSDGSLIEHGNNARKDWELRPEEKKLARVAIDTWRSHKAGKLTYTEDDIISTYTRQIHNVDLLTAEEEVELSKTIEAGLYATQKLAGGKANKGEELSDAERSELVELSLLGNDAFNHFYEANLGLVVSIAKHYTGYGVPFLDLIQEGNLGLRHAVEKFDYKQGFKFSTYASNWIRQTIKRSLGQQRRGIALGDWAYQRLAKLRIINEEFLNENDREPTDDELAERSKTRLAFVKELRPHLESVVSIDGLLAAKAGGSGGDDDENLFDRIFADPSGRTPESVVSENMATQAFRAVLDDQLSKLHNVYRRSETANRTYKLKAKKYDVLALRYGLNGQEPLSQIQTAERLGISRENVVRIETTAFEEMAANEELRRTFYESIS